ncbi:PadR family transcriptional regulator [Pseudorhizobium flavum]|uniref:DNA-binding MarR family transcriptional regulator n=1 Tax=Pseudorhizobium flavum TaxID=1335061 RepID=A0A7W9Z1J8_9HYPH|nr:helix-turn-helix transcriptional regulator [Pseudorhizobium flavum]MBB6182353.1 DNA-binding MarR family transcriptional regulator [Pseudorhizobium flavum]
MPDDVRISGPVMLVLSALGATRNGICGNEILLTTGLDSGSLDPVLTQLERDGWVESDWEDIDPSELERPKRRLYALSDLGRSKTEQLLANLFQFAG